MSPTNTALIYTKVPGPGPLPEGVLVTKSSPFDASTAKLNGGVLLRTLCVSLDPYMRNRMRSPEIKSYSPAFTVGDPLTGHVVAKIEKSEKAGWEVGALVWGLGQYQDYAVVPPSYLENWRLLATDQYKLTPENWIGACGMPGQTAYAGLYNYGKPKKGDKIFISAASGAVGQIVGQLAKRDGLTVIGSAGTDDKVSLLTSKLGFDHAFNYKKSDILTELRKHEPIQIYFDNVGAETLDAFITVADRFARIICCGAISEYTRPQLTGIRNQVQIVGKCLTLQGFIVSNEKAFLEEQKFWDKLPAWVADGSIKVLEDVHNGWETSQTAFQGMMDGKNVGKVVVKVSDP